MGGKDARRHSVVVGRNEAAREAPSKQHARDCARSPIVHTGGNSLSCA